MEKPNYVLKATEAVWVRKNDSAFFVYYRRAVLLFAFAILFFSILFWENLFMEMTNQSKILFLVVIGYAFLGGGEMTRKPSEFEIRFYDDYFELYREKISYDKSLTRKKIQKMYYKDVKEFNYRVNIHRINFYGVVEGIEWKYKKNGQLQEKPCYNKTTDSLCYFYTALSDVDFVREIEEHSPLRVVYTNVR